MQTGARGLTHVLTSSPANGPDQEITVLLPGYPVRAGHDVIGRILIDSGHSVFLTGCNILLPCSAGRVRKAVLLRRRILWSGDVVVVRLQGRCVERQHAASLRWRGATLLWRTHRWCVLTRGRLECAGRSARGESGRRPSGRAAWMPGRGRMGVKGIVHGLGRICFRPLGECVR